MLGQKTYRTTLSARLRSQNAYQLVTTRNVVPSWRTLIRPLRLPQAPFSVDPVCLCADPPPDLHCSRNLESRLCPPLLRIAWTASVLMPLWTSKPRDSLDAVNKRPKDPIWVGRTNKASPHIVNGILCVHVPMSVYTSLLLVAIPLIYAWIAVTKSLQKL